MKIYEIAFNERRYRLLIDIVKRELDFQQYKAKRKNLEVIKDLENMLHAIVDLPNVHEYL